MPSSKLPLTKQLVMVTISVGRAKPRPNELFRQMASSQGELTLVFETRTLRQQSMSIPSRLVSIFRLSMVKLSTPVARMAKCPPCRIEKSRSVTLRQFFKLMALLATPGCSATGRRRTVAAAQSFAPDEPRAEYGDIVQIFAPDQAVAPVAVTKILVLVPLVRLGQIVAAGADALAEADRQPPASRLRPSTA